MKVSRAEVIKTRERVLVSAAKLFRAHGLDGVNVAQIMSAAGLTHGAFYGYFKSKSDLITQMLARALLSDPDAATDRPHDFQDYASCYLSGKHRDDPAEGCPYPALGSELTRAPRATRKVVTQAIAKRIEQFSESAPGTTRKRRRKAAIAGWSAMIGAVTLSRIVDDPKLSDEILQATRRALAAE
jgi:TetR/AcrR family transcriptional regulator, transcriptional repressor for nem operon